MYGRETLSNINTPKQRIDSTTNAAYVYTGIAKEVSIPTTGYGWAWFRTEVATGNVDWAKDANGIPTRDFIFKGNAGASLTYTE